MSEVRLNSTSVQLAARPYSLGYQITRTLYETSNYFFKNNNQSVYWNYIQPLTRFFETKDLKQICKLTIPANGLDAVNLNAIARRVQITSLFRKFTDSCWTKTRGYTVQNYNRMMLCPPVGFRSSCFACRHSMCFNCHLRKAASYKKAISSSDEANSAAIVAIINTPFQDNLYGYSPIYPTKISRFGTFTKSLNPKGKNCLAVNVGIDVKDRHPAVSARFHALCLPEDLDFKYEQAKLFANRVESIESEYQTKVEILKVKDKAELPYHMYNNAGIKLLASSSFGFEDINLQNTVNEFFEMTRSKKLNRIKSI
jgi:hypothetical protein